MLACSPSAPVAANNSSSAILKSWQNPTVLGFEIACMNIICNWARESWLWCRVAIEPKYAGPNRVLKRIGTAKEMAQNNNFSANWIFRAR
jgi:hypothetical protein